mmetsp:Transcript_10151/g.15184  ORF Transcript_10151/g.15184 Transcript_10151/m.15184 type:complete len:393 (-) Transcript_10151:33-1211(-)
MQYQPSLSFSKMYTALPLSFFLENIGVFAAPFLIKTIKIRGTLLLGGLMVSASFLVCSAIKDPDALIWSYSALFGIGAGMITITSFFAAWDHFPNSRGKVTGIIMFGYSASTLVYGILFTFIVNPNNYRPSGSGESLSYGQEVNERVPYGMLIIGLVWGLKTLVGVLLIRPSTVHSKSSMSSPPGKFPLKKILATKQFWQIFLAAYCSFLFWYFIAGIFKGYALKYIQDDHFLSYIGSAAALSGAFGRIFWPGLLDYFEYRKVLSATIFLQFLGCICVHFIVEDKYLFGVVILGVFFCGSAMYPSLAVEVSKIFHSYSAQVWPCVYLGVTLASLTSILLKYGGEHLGYLYIFGICGVFDLVSICIIWFTSEKQVRWNKALDESLLMDINVKI